MKQIIALASGLLFVLVPGLAFAEYTCTVRIPTKPDTYSNMKPDTDSDLMPDTGFALPDLS